MPSSPLGATVLVDMLFLTLNWSISQRWTAMSVLPFILHFPGAFQGLQGMRRRQTRGRVSDRKTVAYTPRAPGLHDSSRAAGLPRSGFQQWVTLVETSFGRCPRLSVVPAQATARPCLSQTTSRFPEQK